MRLSICLATAWSVRTARKVFTHEDQKVEPLKELNMDTSVRIMFPGTNHNTGEVQHDCLPSLASMLRSQNLVMREGESPTLHVLWSTLTSGAIGASQFEELFILQSNSLDHVETAQGVANAGFTNHVDNPSMNQGMGHLHGMVIAAMVHPHQCIKVTARDTATQTMTPPNKRRKLMSVSPNTPPLPRFLPI